MAIPVRRRLIAACAVLVAAAGGVALASPHVRDAVTGRSLGPLPWSSALVTTAAARTVRLQVDLRGRAQQIGCGADVQPSVAETTTTVTISTVVIDRPLPAGVGCAASLALSLPATVHLAAPVGARTLVDGSDRVPHRLLVVDQQPAAVVPAPFTRRSTSWSEASGTVHEWWRWQRHGQSAQVDLDFGPPASLPDLGVREADAGHDRVGTTDALTWRQRSGDLVTTTVTWSPRPDRASS